MHKYKDLEHNLKRYKKDILTKGKIQPYLYYIAVI